ncbi:hypothetical protein [Ligilactobacillus sp. UO.C109]|uniref:hypothetical protein n=1 Tax=Ligilactobacillus sp. UO.C109 TaxID=3003264 RepID=UPI002286A1D1|nr:hypothetical protein [Ligilactobacillus sp. UO.C109]MCZ0744078.1 hypothetical protein [Ligilactobacillus sp. UO.C109]
MNIITTKENRSIAAKLWDKKDISWMARKNRFKEVKGAKFVDWKLDSISVNEEDFYLLVQEDLNIYIAFVKELAEFAFQILTRELDQIYAIPQEQIKLYKKALFNGDVMKIKTRKNVKIKLSELEIDDINYCLESYDVRLPDKEKIMYCIELSNVLSIKSQFGKIN